MCDIALQLEITQASKSIINYTGVCLLPTRIPQVGSEQKVIISKSHVVQYTA